METDDIPDYRDWGMQTDLGKYTRLTPGGIPYKVTVPKV